MRDVQTTRASALLGRDENGHEESTNEQRLNLGQLLVHGIIRRSSRAHSGLRRSGTDQKEQEHKVKERETHTT